MRKLLLAVGALLLVTAVPAAAAPGSTLITDQRATVVHGDDLRIFTDSSGRHHVIPGSDVPKFVPKATAGDISLRINAIDVDGSPAFAPFAQRFTARPDHFATVHLGLYSASAGSGYRDGTAIDSYSDAFPLLFDFPQAFPAAITQYVSAGRWLQGAEAPNGTVLTAPAGRFEPREYSIDWGRGPLVPNLGQYNGFGLECYACLAGSNLTFGLNVLGDSVSDHLVRQVSGSPTSLHLTLDRDGVRLADADGVNGVRLGDVPAGPATYRAVMDLDWSGVPGVKRSTGSYTELPVKSSATDPVLPVDDTCAGDGPCRILPALTLGYQLATDLGGTSTSAVQTLGLTVGHLSYNGVGSRSPITSVTVEVRFGGGKICSAHGSRAFPRFPLPASRLSLPASRLPPIDLSSTLLPPILVCNPTRGIYGVSKGVREGESL